MPATTERAALNYIGHAVSSASIIGVQGRRILILVDDYFEDENRFSFTLNGEPIKVTQTAVHRHGAINGLNLIANGTFSRAEFPWRAGGDECDPVCGLNVSPQWTLKGDGTAYLSTASGYSAYVEYLCGPDNALIPVIAGESYVFAGYFALHRCSAMVHIDLLASDGSLITTVRHSIPKMPGGMSLDNYAKVTFDFAALNECSFVRLRFSIDRPTSSNAADAGGAYLFFTHVSLFGQSYSDVVWPPCQLDARQIASLSAGAAILDITIPRLTSIPKLEEPKLDVIYAINGSSIGNSPLILPVSTGTRLSITGFDGVTFSAELSGKKGSVLVDLVIDDHVVQQRSLHIDDGNPQSVSFRTPDRLLDGGPHVVEFRDAVSGTTFFVNAVTLKAISASWDQIDDMGRLALPIELQPMSRRRYANLLAHARSTAQSAKDDCRPLGVCHDILTGMYRDSSELNFLPIPPQEKADISIIICTSDAMQAYRTVAALLLSYTCATFEVIVSTDDGPDKVAQLQLLVSGLTVVETAQPLGRAQLANRGAEAAKGRFFVFIDPDAEPSAFWLDELLTSFSLFENVGLAGCKLVKPNGNLIGAGGILWSSGARQIFGGAGNTNAEHPQVNYVRQVDYVSDNAMMVSSEVWREVGGFSEDLNGTALEDTDFALKIRTAGYKVIYVPQSVITLHRDGKSKKSKQTSPTRFRQRWSQALQQQLPEGAHVNAAIDFGVKNRILFIDQQVPRVDVDAGSYAAIQEMRLFQAMGYKVTFLPLNLLYSETYVSSLERMGVEVIYAPFAISAEDVLRERSGEFHLVYVTRHHVARAVVPAVRKHNPSAKIILNNADLHFLRELRSAIAQSDSELLRRSLLTRDLELEMMRKTDLTVSYNEVEHAVILSHNLDQTRIAKAPWVVTPSDDIPLFDQRSNVGFVGSFGHRPNVDAMHFFGNEVMPQLLKHAHHIRMLVYGSQIDSEIKSVASDNFVVKGHVPNLSSALGALKVFVAPLTVGAGVKGKVLAAMANGVPTVLSPIAAEGIGAVSGIHYLEAKTPQEWVTAILRLYNDDALWNAVSGQALAFVRENYSFERGVATLRAALEMIDVFPPERPNVLCCRTATPPLQFV